MTLPNNRRLVFYLQKFFENGQLVKLDPIFNVGSFLRHPFVTAIELSSFHFGFNGTKPYIHLNDNDPDDSLFAPLWPELARAQAAGIPVTMMLGGGGGAYTALFENYSTFYSLLKSTLTTYLFDGIDLDIEEQVTLADTEKLIKDLRNHFGADFILTMSPVASELSNNGGLSGLDYLTLYNDVGEDISWFNGQFYNGWGTPSVADYQQAVNAGIPASKIVLGTLGNPANGGSGYVSLQDLAAVASSLTQQYADFGGVASWEYYNTLPTPADWTLTLATAMSLTPAL